MAWPNGRAVVQLTVHTAWDGTTLYTFPCNTCGGEVRVASPGYLLKVLREQGNVEPCSTTCGPEGAA